MSEVFLTGRTPWRFRPTVAGGPTTHQDFETAIDQYSVTKTEGDHPWMLNISVSSYFDQDKTGQVCGLGSVPLTFKTEDDAKIFARAYHEAVNVLVDRDLENGTACFNSRHNLQYPDTERLRRTLIEANDIAQAAYNAASPVQTFAQIDQVARFYLRSHGVEIEGENKYNATSPFAAYRIRGTSSYAEFRLPDAVDATGRPRDRVGLLELYSGDPTKLGRMQPYTDPVTGEQSQREVSRIEFCSTNITGMKELGSDFDEVHIPRHPVPHLHEAFNRAVDGMTSESFFSSWQYEAKQRYDAVKTGRTNAAIHDELLGTPLANPQPFGVLNTLRPANDGPAMPDRPGTEIPAAPARVLAR